MFIETDPSKVNQEEWETFIDVHPNGNIFQSPEMVNVYAKTKNYTPIVSIAFDNQKIVGILIGVIQKELSGILGYFSSRCVVFGGPIVIEEKKEIAVALLNAHNQQVKNKAIYTQFRNLFEQEYFSSAFKNNGYKYAAHLDIHIDLNVDLDEYWNKRKSKLKQNIRKAIKNSIEFKEINDIEELEQAYCILEEVYKKARLPLPDKTFFVSAFKLFNNSVKKKASFFKAELLGEIVGVRFVLLYKDIIYDWYAGSKQQFYKLNPNDFLPYKVIEWGIKNPKYRLFVFGGAGKPDLPYGVRDHKLKFGKKLVEYGRYEKVHKPLLFYIIKKVFLLWQKLK